MQYPKHYLKAIKRIKKLRKKEKKKLKNRRYRKRFTSGKKWLDRQVLQRIKKPFRRR